MEGGTSECLQKGEMGGLGCRSRCPGAFIIFAKVDWMMH